MKTNKICVMFLILTLSLLHLCSCSKEKDSSTGNRLPLVSVTAELTGVGPITYTFRAAASDVDGDPLSYTWDFGEGTVRAGALTESFSYPENKELTVTVTASDGKGKTIAGVKINTIVETLTLDEKEQYQVIEGFGGFGGQDVYWSAGPYTSPAFILSVVNELGLTIWRDELPTSFEHVNDNADPLVTDLSKFNLDKPVDGHHTTLNKRLEIMRDLKAAGVKTFIASVWSPPIWMKHNGMLGNGTNQNSAPPYTSTPGTGTNQLKLENYEEFAEMCVAYVQTVKRETGIDLYALSIQNEPRFSQFYQSCVYDGNALKNLLVVVGKRFRKEGIQTKLFLPEDVGWLQGVESMIKPTLDDPAARQYADIVAVHGYDLDGITASSANASTWQTMYRWAAAHDKPFWMTETSGYPNTHAGALELSRAMLTALIHGQISAWVFWTLSTSNLDEYSLMSSAGQKSKRFYVSRHFFKFIRPGAVRIKAQSPEQKKIYATAFIHPAEKSRTVVVVNDGAEARILKLAGSGSGESFRQYLTTETDNSKDVGLTSASEGIILPAKSVITLYKK